ncbi:MAG: sulfotransferase family 2 domain-containing protein [Cyanobacteria bacterium P01_G01_bin.38]
MVEIVSVHIPKTAGSAFGTLFLQKIYSKNQIYSDYNFASIQDSLHEISPQTKVVHGHFHANKYSSSFPKAKMIVWLRNPVERLISHYFFWMNQENFQDDPGGLHAAFIKQKPSFYDFCHLNRIKNSISNGYLNGVDLKKFYFVGVQEFFGQDIQDLAGLMHVRLPRSAKRDQKLNTNRYPSYQKEKESILADKALIEEIKSVNYIDMKIYEEALSLRAKRLEDYKL